MLEPITMRPITNFPNYFVDIDGNIYRKKKDGKLRLLKILKWGKYHNVTLRKDNKTYNKYVSHLVLETFVGERPEGYEACHGINGKMDDSLFNLSWGSKSKNHGEDEIRDGTSNRGEKCNFCKLTEEQVLEIKSLKDKYSQRKLAKMFNISQPQVCAILNNKTWVWL